MLAHPVVPLTLDVHKMPTDRDKRRDSWAFGVADPKWLNGFFSGGVAAPSDPYQALSGSTDEIDSAARWRLE